MGVLLPMVLGEPVPVPATATPPGVPVEEPQMLMVAAVVTEPEREAPGPMPPPPPRGVGEAQGEAVPLPLPDAGRRDGEALVHPVTVLDTRAVAEVLALPRPGECVPAGEAEVVAVGATGEREGVPLVDALPPPATP